MNNVQANILFAQGRLTTVIALSCTCLPSVSSSVYWIFFGDDDPDLPHRCTHHVHLGAAPADRTQPEPLPGHRVPALKLVAGVGIASTVAAFLIGFVPPS